MKQLILMITAVLTIMGLAACTTIEEATLAESINGDESTVSPSTETTRLMADYDDALPVREQLALGTIELDETDLAIDDALAAELLPLWQAVQSLSNSATTAEAEVNAVVNQIQDSMSPVQIEAIAGMALTTESMTTLFESGAFGFGARGGNARGDVPQDGLPEGGVLGGPGSGLPGQGRPGGGLPGQGGGPGGGGFADLSEDDIATRRAEFAGGNGDSFQGVALIGAVVRLLEEKTGVERTNPPRGLFNTVYEVVGEATGLAIADLQAQTQEGKTFAEIIEENGADLDAVRASLIEAINGFDNADELDAEALADSWLGLGR